MNKTTSSGAGNSLLAGVDAETPPEEPAWRLAVEAVAQRRLHTATHIAALDESLAAVASALVDTKLKAAKTSTGQTLVAFEHAMRRWLKDAIAKHGSCGGVGEEVVQCQLLPSWPALRGASAPAALSQMLFHIEQRLLLAHTGMSHSGRVVLINVAD